MNADSVQALVPYFNLLLGFDDRNPVAMDRSHNMFLIGAVLAKKPQHILELGIGSGYLRAA